MARVSSAEDLSDYLARRTSAHILGRLGSARYSDGSFEYNPKNPGELIVFGGYVIKFKDLGNKLLIVLDSLEEKMDSIKEQLKRGNEWVEISVQVRDRKVIERIGVHEGREFGLEIVPAHFDNSFGRTRNKNELFHSVYRSAVVPVLERILALING